MFRKVICIILTSLMILSVFGCAAPNATGDTVKSADDVNDNEAIEGSDKPEYSGTVTFYSESVDEAGKKPSSENTYKLNSEQAKQIAEILSGVEWHYEGLLDIVSMSYDGEIFIDNMDKAVNIGDAASINDCECYLVHQVNGLYFRYKPVGEKYYLGYYGSIDEEQMLYIRDMHSKLSCYLITKRMRKS